MLLRLIVLNFIAFNAYAFDLKVGDILLQPLNCWSCSLIEAQTQSEFSHIGVVIKIEHDQVHVAESFQSVRKVSLNEFNSKTQKGLKLKVMRPYYVAPNIETIFDQAFLGLKYDSAFRWDNFENRKELIYCSELVYKLYVKARMNTPVLTRMSFDVNRQAWEKFFKGNIPEGELGISPAAFDDESLYEFIGYL